MRVARFVWLAVVVGMLAAPLYRGLNGLDLENDEAIHSVVTESILETGHWLTPQSSREGPADFVEKPPLKFWIVALPIKLGILPDNEFGLRFWDATFGALVLLYVFLIGDRMAGPFAGFASALALFSFDPLLLQHGFRTNNMDAAQVLAYCGGVYHFLRWDSAGDTRAGWTHAAATGFFFFLGFMTKFVAVAFLPMVLGGVVLMTPGAPTKLLRQWRVWAVVGAVVLALIAPWFLYQTHRLGVRFWEIILGEHVLKRFSRFLNPEHVHPWNFYFIEISNQMLGAQTFWLVVAGAALVLVRAVRKPWVEGTLVLFWVALPLALISAGTSKLLHYSYPFIPPLALCAGYLFGWLEQGITALVTGPRPAWAERSFGGLFRRLTTGAPGPTGLRLALGATAVAGLLVMAASLAGFVSPEVARAGTPGYLIVLASGGVTLALAAVAGQFTWIFRIALPVMLLLAAPLQKYSAVRQELMVERHPLRSARNCIQNVRAFERREGHVPPTIFAWLPPGFYQHPYYYYFRDAGLDRHQYWNDEALASTLDDVGSQRAVLMPKIHYKAFCLRMKRDAAASVPFVDLDNVVLLLPGPFLGCAPR